jgi:hypothetical protein
LPGVERNKQGKIERKPTKRERQAMAVAKRLGLGTRAAAGRLLHGYIEERWKNAAAQAGRFKGTLKWPVNNGWFVRGYGSGQGGYHKAMDIAGKMGSNVRKNCDPAPLFRPGVKRRNGKLARVKYTEWRRAGQRPEEVRCAKRQKHPLGQSVLHENPEMDAAPVPEDTTAPDPEQKPPADPDEGDPDA